MLCAHRRCLYEATSSALLSSTMNPGRASLTPEFSSLKSLYTPPVSYHRDLTELIATIFTEFLPETWPFFLLRWVWIWVELRLVFRFWATFWDICFPCSRLSNLFSRTWVCTSDLDTFFYQYCWAWAVYRWCCLQWAGCFGWLPVLSLWVNRKVHVLLLVNSYLLFGVGPSHNRNWLIRLCLFRIISIIIRRQRPWETSKISSTWSPKFIRKWKSRIQKRSPLFPGSKNSTILSIQSPQQPRWTHLPGIGYNFAQINPQRW